MPLAPRAVGGLGRRLFAGAVAAFLLALPAYAHADPQWNASLLTGVCGTGSHAYWQHTCWFNGLRSDVLFGRSQNTDVGVGPYLHLTTAGFEDVRLGGGVTTLLPVHPYFPLGLSAGGYARHSAAGWEPGLSGWLFVGSKSYNYHSSYIMTGGLLVGLNYGLGRTRERTIVIAAQIDGLVLALPFIIGYEWLRGPPSADH
jgi:hypothetical protein